MTYPRSKMRFAKARPQMPIQGVVAPPMFATLRKYRPVAATGAFAAKLGDDSDLGNWFTDILNVGPKVFVPGVTEAPPLVHYNAWRDAVLKRGNTPARIPSGPNAGKWGERYIDQYGTARFANAPQNVWDEDVSASSFNQQAADVAAAPGKILSGAAAIPRQVIGSALGIPQWLMPVLLLGGAAIAVRQFLPKR
jgi:hypothetical protein